MLVENIGELVVYKNNQLIAFNKPSTLPVQEDKTKDKSLLNLAEIYCKSNLYLIHRIDRPASGLVLFAKTKKALAFINAQFQDRSIKKTYLAVVKNKPEQSEGKLVHFLKKNQKQNRSYLSKDKTAHSKEAILNYKVVDSIDNYHLLEVEIETGRHHQIRAQLAAIGSPIKGDVKYGFKRGNTDRSIHLHAWKLVFKHPTTKAKEELTIAPPDEVVWNAFEYLKKK